MPINRVRIRKLLVGVALLVAIWWTCGYIAALQLTATAPQAIADRKEWGGFPVENVNLTTADHVSISAWMIRGKTAKTVILLSGIRGNRSDNLDRATCYLQKGYSVFLPDLRGTGKSGGDRISFGWHERLDLLAAVDWLKRNHHDTIAVHGMSLGAAAIAYSFDSIRDYDFVVMESCYDNIDHAFSHRMNDFPGLSIVAWPIIAITEYRLGVSTTQLAPELYMSKYVGPVLYLAGNAEVQLPLTETQRIFSRFPGKEKSLYIFDGAPHCDLLSYDRPKYLYALTAFLNTQSTRP